MRYTEHPDRWEMSVAEDDYKLSRVLAAQDIETAPPIGNQLPILLNGRPLCRA